MSKRSGYLGDLWTTWRTSKKLMYFYVFFKRSWAFWGRSWSGLGAVLGRSWRGLWALLGGLGASWERLEPVLARLGAVLRAPRCGFSAVAWPLDEL